MRTPERGAKRRSSDSLKSGFVDVDSYLDLRCFLAAVSTLPTSPDKRSMCSSN